MKTKSFIKGAILWGFCMGTALAGGGFSVHGGSVFFTSGSCLRGPVNSACFPIYRPCAFQPFNYCNTASWYGWGPLMVYSSYGTASSISGDPIFTTNTVPLGYQVPPPVPLTSPVITYPVSFGWHK
ncbi:MAG: hypothetical protein ABI443_08240 [Chthoniobacterales bacterium]